MRSFPSREPFPSGGHSLRDQLSRLSRREIAADLPRLVIEDVHADQASAYVLFVEGLEELPSREVLLRDVVIRTHGRPLVQEYRLWLKRPSSAFCNYLRYRVL